MAAPAPVVSLSSLQSLQASLKNDLGKVEKVMSELEAQYLQAEHSQSGHVLRGFEGMLSKDNMRKRARTSKQEEKGDERAFSLSSKTSAVAREVQAEGYENDAELMQARRAQFAQKGYAQKRYGEKGR